MVMLKHNVTVDNIKCNGQYGDGTCENTGNIRYSLTSQTNWYRSFYQ